MHIVKSAGVGLLCVLGIAIAAPFVAIAVAIFMPSPKGGGSWGWDPVSFIRSPLAWAIFAAVFVLGFLWEYRRLAH